MIDCPIQDAIPLSRLPLLLKPFRNGKRLARTTPHQWATHGIHNVKLETIKVGASRLTSKKALLHFFASAAPHLLPLADDLLDQPANPTTP